MSTIRYTLDFDRIAVIPTPKGKMNVGRVTIFHQHEDGTIDVEIEFNPLVPRQLIQALEKNPGAINIEVKSKIVKKLVVLED